MTFAGIDPTPYRNVISSDIGLYLACFQTSSYSCFVETLHSVGQATTKTYRVAFQGQQGQLQSLREQQFTALIDPSFSSIKFLLISTVELVSGGKNFSTLKTNFSTLFHRPTYPRYHHLPTHLRPRCRSSSGVACVHSECVHPYDPWVLWLDMRCHFPIKVLHKTELNVGRNAVPRPSENEGV